MLYRTFLRALIIGGRVTAVDAEGAAIITVVGELIDAADLVQLERVEVRPLSGGATVAAVLLRGPAGGGAIRVGGGLGGLEDGCRVEIAAWSVADRTELPGLRARIVAVDADNRVVETLEVPVAGSDELPGLG